MKTFKLLAAGAILSLSSWAAHAGVTFDAVKAKGFVHCGVSTGVAGFSIADGKGGWKGLDVDLCRALAVAMFNDVNKAKITVVSALQRFTALQSGEVDVLPRNTTITMARDTTLGLIGVGVNYYDSQGIMVNKSLGVKSAKELGGATICVQPGTTTELNLADWFRAQNIVFKPVVVDTMDEIVRAFVVGRCDAFTGDKSQLAGARSTLQNPDSYDILPENFSKEPLGPMVRQGDEQWFNLVRWTMFAMLEAEEYGVTSRNVDEMLKSSNPNVQRLLGVTPGMGKNLGVDDKWAYNVIKTIGNYGESFERNVGQDSALKLPRGLNASYKDGGLMYGWPVR
ncbi:amino acid ABC transporter substrate-binding protein [Bordetella genomosp. 10]|uniref:Amino acid ABC transporter substrate-binding protein n=1 Tax=Bordetella genomosp. 10 TaxID=1416804 RepID=A0A261SC11_9BORD|nr:amino acid ABC transporter substrate-binding protein [Bordetella genomosp. 10]OZI34939.1 amino acid ABC transporter substrate-binding protein [Bordetella genomosp. 10]